MLAGAYVGPPAKKLADLSEEDFKEEMKTYEAEKAECIAALEAWSR